MRRAPVVAIDGPAGSGKSTLGQSLARALNFRYIDTGAMYRAVGLCVLAEPDPEGALARVAELCRAASIELEWDAAGRGFGILLNGRDVTQAVRTADAARMASRVAAVPAVREELVRRQREIARDGAVVMEGRDIGTVVFPDAEYKVFLDADLGERGARRSVDEGRGSDAVQSDLRERDSNDRSRAVAPLVAAADAIHIDSTAMNAAAVLGAVLARIRGGTGQGGEAL